MSAISLKSLSQVVFILFIAFFSFIACSKSSVPTGAEQGGSETTAAKPEETGQGKSASVAAPRTEASKPQENPSESYPPKVDSARLQFESIGTGDRFKVIAVGSDMEGNPVTFTYEWTKNGEPAGEGDSITGFHRGDRLSVKITPYNGKVYGLAKVLTTEVKNTPPKIIEHKDMKFDGKTVTYQVKAFDPDGDTLAFSLKSPPSGMSINSTTGLIQWNVPEGYSGRMPVAVVVNDGNGGETSYTFKILIAPEKGAK